MKHACPKCGFEYVGDLDKCPNCGFLIKEDSNDNIEGSQPLENLAAERKDTSKENEVDATISETKEFAISDINDDIQWSDFEDMSIGSVAEILNDTLDEDDLKELQALTDKVENAEKEQLAEQATTEDDDTKEFDFELSENDVLAQYIKAHRHSTTHEGQEITDGETEELVTSLEETTEIEVSDELSDTVAEESEVLETEVSDATEETTVEVVAEDDAETLTEEVKTPEIDMLDSEELEEAVVSEKVSESAEEVVEETETEAVVTATEEVSEEVTENTDEQRKGNDTPPNLFVLDTEEAKRLADEIAERDAYHEAAEESEDYFEFDDPDLVPLPSEDESVAKKFANLPKFNETAKNLDNHSRLQPLPEFNRKKLEQQLQQKRKTDLSDTKAIVPQPEPTAKDVRKPEVQSQPVLPETTNEAAETAPKKSRKKWLYLGAAAVLLAGGGSYYVYYQNQQKVAEAARVAKEQKATAEAMTNIEKELNAFYTDDTQEFIKSEKVNASLGTIKVELDKYSKEDGYQDLVKAFDKVKEKVTTIKDVNGLFTTPIINGHGLVENPMLKADKEITLTKPETTGGFDTLVKQAIEVAEEQYQTLQTAKTKVALVYQSGRVLDSATRENYDVAVAAVAAIKNSALAKDLQSQLKDVNTYLTEKEATTNPAGQNGNSTTSGSTANTDGSVSNNGTANNNSGTSSNAGSGSSYGYTIGDGGAVIGFTMNTEGKPIVETNTNDVNDTANSAWVWAGDVKETVINKCIERGYITADAYTLQPAVIVNGNGIYNLFRGDGSYVVSINCKTGWFKGNGPGGPNTRVN
ncbi:MULTISPECIES: cell division site-positioning protein MapZ family protein [unclassified Enterococcus]|uniref:cell division site-positioning protein MapZ family protein n=1 Tax=unclassified Enterococcus TaxID=2608891 RepID=UPI0024768220|nr:MULTISPECIES: cell division site-positioning protein MapZ family protein [unclassified Enterococcus]